MGCEYRARISRNKMNIFYEADNYLRSLPKYLVGSGAAFTVDLIAYASLKPYLGISKSLSISFLVGTITLYSILRLTTNSKIRKKRIGLILQVGIGLGSFLINYWFLIQFEGFFDVLLRQPMMFNEHFIAGLTKFIAACIGFIWSSYMTMKLNFESR